VLGEGGREGAQIVEAEQEVLINGDDGGAGVWEEPGTHLLGF